MTSAPATAKVVVITGASSGIGKSIAIALSSRRATKSEKEGKEGEDYRLVLAARRADALAETVALCGGAEFAIAVPTDVTSRENVRALVQQSVKHWGRIDVFINNAGRGCSVVPSELTAEVLDDMVTVNVKSAMYGTQEAAAAMLNNESEKENGDKKGGLIINVSSLLGRVPMPNPYALERSAYTMSKHMLTAFTELFRVEMAQKKAPIRVALFSPGIVGTDFGTNAGGGDSRTFSGAQPVEEVADILIDEIIINGRDDVYSRPVYKTVVERHVAEIHKEMSE